MEIVIGQPYIGGAYDIGEGRHGERRGNVNETQNVDKVVDHNGQILIKQW